MIEKSHNVAPFILFCGFYLEEVEFYCIHLAHIASE